MAKLIQMADASGNIYPNTIIEQGSISFFNGVTGQGYYEVIGDTCVISGYFTIAEPVSSYLFEVPIPKYTNIPIPVIYGAGAANSTFLRVDSSQGHAYPTITLTDTSLSYMFSGSYLVD